MTDGLTLFINLAAGDVAYAEPIVRGLAAAHRPVVTETLVTVDRSRPQRTRLTNPDDRCREPKFSSDLATILAALERLKREGLVDRVLCLEQDDAWLAEVARKYSGRWIPETHDYGGRPITGYWAGIEAARTRYVIHYDGDMFLYQAPGFDWALHAVEVMARHPLAVTASPRLTPPYAARLGVPDGPSVHEGIPCVPTDGGWKQFYFSTRAFVVDREKFERYLPVGRGRMLAEQLLVKYARRGFPRSAEKMVWMTLWQAGAYRLLLNAEQAWVLHPNWKPAEYPAMVPGILDAVTRHRFPDEQLGHPEIQLEAWKGFLRA